MIHPEIKKFWSGPGVSFFNQECCVPDGTGMGYIQGYHHMLYCRNFAGYYIPIAKTAPYINKDQLPTLSILATHKYEFYYLNKLSPKEYYTTYSEREILKIIRLKAFL